MICIINKSKHHKGNDSDYYTIKAVCEKNKLNITYDTMTDKVVIHEWYRLTKEQRNIVIRKVKDYIKNNSEQ